MKRSISLLLVIFLTLIHLVIPTHAGNCVNLVVGGANVVPGEIVTIPISITSNSGFVSMSLYLTYDMTALTLVSCDDTGLIEGGKHSSYFASPYMLTWENDVFASNITNTGTIVNLTFLVNDNAKEGNYSIIIRIPTDGILDANGESVYAENAEGIITIAEEHECSFGNWQSLNQNKHIRYCEDCEKKETRNHNWNDGEMVVKPTHKDEGEILYTCEYCSAEKTEEISPIEHAYGSWTNFDDKQHKRECDCGDVVYEDHLWNDGVTSAGIITYTCEECGFTKTENEEHSYSVYQTVAPTCTDNGYTVYKCSECGATYQDDIVAATGHSYSVTVIQPTCQDNGYTQHFCKNCGDFYKDNYVSTVDHRYQNNECVYCGAVDPGYENDQSSPKVIVSESKGTAGSTVTVYVSLENNPGFNVMNFGLLYDETVLTLVESENLVESLNFNAQSAYVWDGDSDYNSNGNLLKLTFTISDTASKGDYIVELKLLGVSNENFEEVPFLTVDGKITVHDTVYGDANGDGKVSVVDLSMLRKYFANIDPSTGISSISVKNGADANGDGKVSVVDLSMLRKYFAYIDPATGESSLVLGPRN